MPTAAKTRPSVFRLTIRFLLALMFTCGVFLGGYRAGYHRGSGANEELLGIITEVVDLDKWEAVGGPGAINAAPVVIFCFAYPADQSAADSDPEGEMKPTAVGADPFAVKAKTEAGGNPLAESE